MVVKTKIRKDRHNWPQNFSAMGLPTPVSKITPTAGSRADPDFSLLKLLFDCNEAARRSSPLFNQERQYDHLNSIFLNLLAVDKALATSHGLFNQSTIAAWMRAPVPMRS